MARDTLAGYAHVQTYEYTTPAGALIFEKRRFELLDPISGQRSKTFRYFDPETRSFRKPPGADRWLYRLDEVVTAVGRGRTVHWAEGEKDADALRAAGRVATSHHQGAGRVTVEQATWLRDARHIVLWVDLDRGCWEVGAYDACLRFNLLLEAGANPAAIRFVRARRGKDAADHLAAGFKPRQAIAVDPRRLAAVARDYTSSAPRKAGYRRG